MSDEQATVSVRLATEKDAMRISHILRRPEVAVTFSRENTSPDFADVHNVVASMQNVLWLVWDGGCFLVVPVTKSCFEVHVAILPEYRGSMAYEAAEIAIGMVFTRTECVLLVGRTPLANRPARGFAALCGMKPVRISGNNQISSLSFFDWLARRQDPVFALSQCEEWGHSAKSEASRHVLDWITRGEIAKKEPSGAS